jgi:hypothetical protein
MLEFVKAHFPELQTLLLLVIAVAAIYCSVLFAHLHIMLEHFSRQNWQNDYRRSNDRFARPAVKPIKRQSTFN